MKLGVCWYPEQWPRMRWVTDATMMADAGLELVRIGEFAWSWIEPARGEYAWEGMDEAVRTLSDAGLLVVLGTPPATPPVWLMRERPEVLSVGPDGRRRAYGSRRHTCPTSAAYREEAARVVAALVERYGRHEAVAAWQLDNEPGNHDSARCWCDECQAAFVAWLRARYGTVEALNAAWGDTFWSMSYPDFEAVRLPVPTKTAHDPALELAHRRFAAAQAADGLREQAAIVRAGSPDREVCTNLYLGDVDIDGQLVARPNGLAALDSYPHGLDGPDDVGFVLDLARGSALPTDAGAESRGGRAWIMEQQPGPVNWTPGNPVVPPGQVRLWGWQAALHGVEALLFFRWRAARAGQEQHHSGLLRHDGTPDQGLTEAARLARELHDADDAVLQRPLAQVALPYAYDDAWMLDILPHVPEASHRRLVVAAHAAVRAFGHDVDVVPVDADLTGYRWILAPGYHLATPARVERLRAAVDAGATLLIGPRSLMRDVDGRWLDEALPGGFAEALGARVDHAGSPQAWPRQPDAASRVRVDDRSVTAGAWIETLTGLADDVEVLARADGGPLDGAPVAVRRGRLVHVGVASREAWVAVLGLLMDDQPAAAACETFRRAGQEVVLDHAELRIDRIPDRT